MPTTAREEVVRYFQETTFGTGPVDWAASGVPFLCIEPNFEAIVQMGAENRNYKIRAYHPHATIRALRNGTLSFGIYFHGRGGTPVAEGANATAFYESNLVRNAWGGIRLGRASGIDEATTAVITLDENEGAEYRPGDWMFLVNAADLDDAGQPRGHFVRVESIAVDAVTLLFAAPFEPPDDASGTSGAVIVGYPHTRSIINRAHANHFTHSFHYNREGTDDVIEARGVKLNLTAIEGIVAGEQPVIRFEGLSATHDNEGLTRVPDPLEAELAGDAPVTTATGEDTLVWLGDVGAASLTMVPAHAITVQPGIASQPVSGPGGVEGRHGYTGTSFTGTGVEITLEQDDAYQDEWEDGDEKQLLIQIGTQRGRAIGIYFPRLTYRADPSRTASQDLSVSVLQFEARELEDATETLTADALEQYRAKIQLLWSA